MSTTTEWTHKKTVMVSATADTYVRLNMMLGLFVGHVVPEEVTKSQALPKITKLRLAQ